MISTDIVIIDSGVNVKHSNFTNEIISGIQIFYEDKKYLINNDIIDKLGHGTAIYNIIHKYSPKSQIFNIKIFDDEDYINEDDLIFALNYVKNNISCKIINLSMGIKSCENIHILEKLCNDLYDMGVLIVSAFDNEGCYSYPASFDKVIGVANNYKCLDAFHFEFVEGSPVNILAKGGLQRVAWSNYKDVILGGSSFACANVTAYIANHVKDKNLKYEEIMEILKKQSKTIYTEKKYNKKDNIFNIKCAAIFPVNKEMHSLLRFSNKLKFEIIDIYDIKQSGRVGANMSTILNTQLDKDMIVKDITKIDFTSFDTIILGHLDELNRMLDKDIRYELIINSIKNNINIFSFDDLDHYEEVNKKEYKVYYPKVTLGDIPQNTFGKLYVINKPVLAIFGTSSKQGKFTLQILLRDLLENAGYKVGTIGTEPQSLLFDMNYSYPMGYNSTIYIDNHSSIILLNNMLHNLCNQDYEIIITGSQANSIPSNFMNVSAYPIKQHNFLLGTQPDAIILCINPYDDKNYILNTIKYLEGSIDSHVIALVVFPMSITNDWRRIYNFKIRLDEQALRKIVDELTKIFNIPIFRLGNEKDMQDLCTLIIDYF